MTTKRATAPKMTVMRVDRVGGWGSVNYHHSLTEVRRRCAKVGDRIACVRCQEVLERRAALAELAPTNQISNTDEAVAAEMTQESRIKANIASLLGIPVDTIAVALGPTRQIVIFLSPQEVTRLSGT